MSFEPSAKLLQDASSTQITIVDMTKLCSECLDHKAALQCIQCEDQYCDLCFAQLHRFGFRALHRFELLEGFDIHTAHLNTHVLPTEATDTVIPTSSVSMKKPPTVTTAATPTATSSIPTVNCPEDIPDYLTKIMLIYPLFKVRCKYVPLRLNDEERYLLQILESALNISEYVDKVDVLQSRSRDKIINEQTTTIYNLIASLYISRDFKKGVKSFLKEGVQYQDNAAFLQHIFEIGRRHKIRNPDKLRTGYGKLMAIVADSKLCRTTFGFDLAVEIRSVSTRCQMWGIEEMLSDPLLQVATCQLDTHAGDSGSVDPQLLKIALEIRNTASKTLAQKYSQLATQFISQPNYASLGLPKWYDDDITPKKIISPDNITLLIQSISDAHNYLYQCFTPVHKVHQRLKKYFSPGSQVLPIDLRGGVRGARLTHSSETQFMFVNQTFTLWEQILLRIYMLWYAADNDLLCGYSEIDPATGYQQLRPVSYSLRFFEQGIVRLQSCPLVGRIMSECLNICFKKFEGNWVGSSAVHLADENVPNAFYFIDKYTQLERILGPLDRTLRNIEEASESSDHLLHGYFKEYYAALKDSDITTPILYRILQDYFRHSFDASGAANDKAGWNSGSCIDGRLTSTWEWCNNIAKKDYYHAFLMTGFTGFDG